MECKLNFHQPKDSHMIKATQPFETDYKFLGNFAQCKQEKSLHDYFMVQQARIINNEFVHYWVTILEALYRN